ncbi:hypothetical protein HYX08_01560 [Candidatus Woesearchaeota archaeon]|nr:hypothetical protein [Candidatus Woesearchaeota archaeon]
MYRHIWRVVRIILGTLLIIAGVIMGFIPILQGWIFVLAGLLLIGVKRKTIKKWLKKAKFKIFQYRR